MDLERLRERAAVHAALSDPHRLAIVDRLSLTDATPSQLADAFGIETNLLAHHLSALEHAGLIERIRSQGDQRRRYLRLRRSALHVIAPLPRLAVQRVVFVCSENAARSQLAQAIWNNRREVPPATSGGTDPAERVHTGAVRAARRRGLELGEAKPSVIPALTPGDLLITVCDRANEHLAATPGARLHWSIPDPATSTQRDAYDAAAELLAGRIHTLSDCVCPA